jgi:hypothetical protein
MRSLCIATVTASLTFASVAWAEPLSPGKPAGIREARHGASTGLLLAGGLLVGGLVAVVALSGGNNNTGVLSNAISTAATTG